MRRRGGGGGREGGGGGSKVLLCRQKVTKIGKFDMVTEAAPALTAVQSDLLAGELYRQCDATFWPHVQS